MISFQQKTPETSAEMQKSNYCINAHTNNPLLRLYSFILVSHTLIHMPTEANAHMHAHVTSIRTSGRYATSWWLNETVTWLKIPFFPTFMWVIVRTHAAKKPPFVSHSTRMRRDPDENNCLNVAKQPPCRHKPYIDPNIANWSSAMTTMPAGALHVCSTAGLALKAQGCFCLAVTSHGEHRVCIQDRQITTGEKMN